MKDKILYFESVPEAGDTKGPVILQRVATTVDTSDPLMKAVFEALQKCDLEGLLSCGAPESEYDGECTAIAKQITEKSTAKQIGTIVLQVFEKEFEYCCTVDTESADAAGEEIYHRIHAK